MKLKNILRTAGTLAAPFIPGGPLILAAVNAFLPEDQKLPEMATATQIQDKISTLPPEQQSAIYEKEIDLQIVESNNFSANIAALAEVDKVGASSRPKIAKWMAFVVVVATLQFTTALFWAVVYGGAEIEQTWPLALAVLGTPTALLRAYFGMRTKEKEARYNAAAGTPIAGMLPTLINAIKGR